jgi:regulator of replication initiation timing
MNAAQRHGHEAPPPEKKRKKNRDPQGHVTSQLCDFVPVRVKPEDEMTTFIPHDSVTLHREDDPPAIEAPAQGPSVAAARNWHARGHISQADQDLKPQKAANQRNQHVRHEAQAKSRRDNEDPTSVSDFEAETNNNAVSNIQHLQSNVQYLQSNVQHLQGTIQRVQTDGQTTQVDVKQVKTSIQNVITDVKHLQTGVEDLQTGVVDLQTDVEALQAEMHHLRDTIRYLQLYIDTYVKEKSPSKVNRKGRASFLSAVSFATLTRLIMAAAFIGTLLSLMVGSVTQKPEQELITLSRA